MVQSHEEVSSRKGKKKSQKGRPAPDKRPARARYWASGNLAYRKVRNLVRSGYKAMDALNLWESTRKRKKGEINIARIAKLDR